LERKESGEAAGRQGKGKKMRKEKRKTRALMDVSHFISNLKVRRSRFTE
jgi:hypothetical protein